jgi:hypothetical protein
VFLASRAWASDISIRSGKGSDTVILAGPGAEDGTLESMRMESDPDNGTLLQVAPHRGGSGSVRPPETLIIIPEIHTRGKK